jgi:thiamine-monophosphate kinase
MLSEFDLIKQYFDQTYPSEPQFALGIGDDCALINPSPNMQLAISSDMLVSGRHFFPDADPTMLGHKCLAVNLSDLAAMGAKPIAFTLALSLPEANRDWLAQFSQGLFAIANAHNCRLIGGDTTKGPLNICISIFGELPPGTALRRDAAQVNDDIWISGTLGDARLALAAYWKELELSEDAHRLAAQRMHKPSPRVALGIALRGIAHAALDISDGLVGDLGHILKRSNVGARLDIDKLPRGDVLKLQSQNLQRQFTLAGGDDYELCFTAPASNRDAVIAAGIESQTQVSRVGTIEQNAGLRFFDNEGTQVNLQLQGFDHFSHS